MGLLSLFFHLFLSNFYQLCECLLINMCSIFLLLRVADSFLSPFLSFFNINFQIAGPLPFRLIIPSHRQKRTHLLFSIPCLYGLLLVSLLSLSTQSSIMFKCIGLSTSPRHSPSQASNFLNCEFPVLTLFFSDFVHSFYIAPHISVNSPSF